jgi:AAA+ superfamily predicted ATPase
MSTETDARTEATSSDLKASTFSAKVRSRAPLIVVVTPEEVRVKPYLFEAAAAVNPPYETRFYDIAQGFTDLSGKLILGDRGQGNIEEAFAAIKENRSRCVWVMLDMIPWLREPVGLINQRALKNLIEFLPKQPSARAQSIVLVTSNPDIPPEIANDAQIIEWPMPDRAEMGRILDEACDPILTTERTKEDGFTAEQIKEWKQIQGGVLKSITGDARAVAIGASIGLTQQEAASCFATSLVMQLRIDPVLIALEKKEALARSGLESFDPLPDGLDAVGGLENVKDWWCSQALAFTPAGREFGLTTPKALLLMGIPGCGKTHIAKAIGTARNCPTVKLDLGGQKSKFVGESEQNLRNSLDRIDAQGEVVVLVDEVEKALAGATGESGDGGVSADALGTLLSWMQDRTSEAFVIFTANDVSKLPPELMRKGRVDEIFWVDVPNPAERPAVLATAIRERRRSGTVQFEVDLDAVAEATDQFTGAEIAALVPAAMRIAFVDGRRPVSTDDLLTVAGEVKPLAVMQKDKLDKLREEWGARTKPASKADTTPTKVRARGAGSRQLDI